MRRALALVAAAGVAAVVAGCGGSSSSTQPAKRHRHARVGARHRAKLRRIATLPAPVQDPATAAAGAKVLLAGGLDRNDVSSAALVRVNGSHVAAAGTLPQAFHDAAATTIGGTAYVFGGGEPSRDAIIELPGGHRSGTLPAAASDVAAASIGDKAYVVGGYTGTQPLDTIVEWQRGAQARVVAHVPRALRYAAVAAAAGKLVIAGGTDGTTAVRDVYSFDPATRSVRRLARLPHPLTHAAAAALGGTVYVAGGRGSQLGTQARAVLALDAASGHVSRVAKLPVAASDMGAAALGGKIVLAGGRDAAGRVLTQVLELSP